MMYINATITNYELGEYFTPTFIIETIRNLFNNNYLLIRHLIEQIEN
jgi:hypothetical protein